jgi:hypothetical protein
MFQNGSVLDYKAYQDREKYNYLKFENSSTGYLTRVKGFINSPPFPLS